MLTTRTTPEASFGGSQSRLAAFLRPDDAGASSFEASRASSPSRKRMILTFWLVAMARADCSRLPMFEQRDLEKQQNKSVNYEEKTLW